FSLHEYRWESERWGELGKRDDGPVAIAAVGGGAIGVDHKLSGTIVAWTDTNLIKNAPVEILKTEAPPKLAHTQWAMRLAISNNRAWVLDGTSNDVNLLEKSFVVGRRNRLMVYELKD